MNGSGESPEGAAWEEAACLLCGAGERTVVVEAPHDRADAPGPRPAVVRCAACGLCYTSPRPTPESIRLFYPDDYAPHEAKKPIESTRETRRSALAKLGLRRRREIRWHGEGRLLDFGCGAGAFLKRMDSQGWKVLGVDAAEPVVRRIREELGLAAVVGDLGAPELRPASFDLVTMRHSLEHVHDPVETLRQAFRLLAPGGKLMVWVPNIESLPFRWFGPAWFGLDLPRHLTHFAPSTLRRMVSEAGFEQPHTWMVPHASWLRRSAARARELGNTSLKSWWLARRPAARLATWYATATRRADCIGLRAMKTQNNGVGSHSSATERTGSRPAILAEK